MSVTITVPKEYGYVIATTAATFFLSAWHGLREVTLRKPTNLKHPIAFADSAQQAAASPEEKKKLYLYNCAVRAHANYIEAHPSTAIAILVSGLQYPIASSVMGAAWIVGRILYAVGYTRADKQGGRGRSLGFMVSFPIQLGLWGLAAWSGIRLVL